MPDSSGSSGGGGRILFEETLSMNDDKGTRSLIRFTRVAALFLIVVSLAAVVLVVRSIANTFVSMVGGVDVALSIAGNIWSERPLVFGGVLLVGLLFVGYGLFSIGGLIRQMRRAFDEQIHVRVTDAGIAVQRQGSRYWQSSGIAIPFDTITSVEYLDLDESSTRLELGDWRAQKFFAGRSRSWIRLERADDSAVYVGSDRPIELAETIARKSPGAGEARPY